MVWEEFDVNLSQSFFYCPLILLRVLVHCKKVPKLLRGFLLLQVLVLGNGTQFMDVLLERLIMGI